VSLHTLNYKIFRLVGGLLSFSLLAVLLMVWWSTTEHIRDQAQRDLDVAESIITQVLESREDQLFNSVDVLTEDPRFKQAVADNEQATIDAMLKHYSRRISADVTALLTLEGATVSSVNGAFASGEFFPDQKLLAIVTEDGGTLSLVNIHQQLYQVIMLVVDAPEATAIVLLGFKVDQSLLQELQAVTKLQVTLLSYREGEVASMASSLDKSLWPHALEGINRVLGPFSLLLLDENAYLSKRFLLQDQTDEAIYVVLSEDIHSLFYEFNQLQIKIILIALLSIIVALLLVLFFSRNLTQPLLALETLAKQIAAGQYQASEPVKTNTRELNNLAGALDVMQSDIQKREETIQFQASYDALTGLLNRYEIARWLQENLQNSTGFSVVILKVMDFRTINNTFGLRNSDRFLQLFSSRLKNLHGVAARMGDGEFLWVPERPMSQGMLQPAREQLERSYVIDDVAIQPKLALGLLQFPDDIDDVGSVFRRLNITANHAQKHGEPLAVYRQEMEEVYLERLKMISELKQALMHRRNEFTLCYQPKLCLQSQRCDRVEALIRWRNETLGFVPPDVFIPLAEQVGLINRVTEWVVGQVIRDVACWREEGLCLQVAINLSVHDVTNPDLLPMVLKGLHDNGLPCEALAFEITESNLMRESDDTIRQLNFFREKGFSLSIDDFGTGYSSLAYIKTLPVSELKIDKSFVLNLEDEAEDQSIVQTIITLARQFGLEVVAEGVENKASLDMLQRWQCDWIQGYYLSKPLPAADVLQWMDTGQQRIVK